MRLLRRPLLLLGAACTLVLSLSGQTVRVLSVSGEATLQGPGDPAPRVIKKGDTIVVGTKIITGDGARVILTPLPGVNSIISPKSEVVIERVSVSPPDAATQTSVHSAVLDLKAGAVTTDLKSSPGVALDYGVRTARGLAGARGTTYTVGINAAGIQTVVVADGRISLTLADGRVIDLVPGQVSITRTDGGTQAVNSASELSTGDQAIADNWMEITLDALAEAVEQGVDIDPSALEDAARAARELGIDIDADTQARLDRARDLLQERRQARLDSARGDDRGDNQNSRTVVTENRGGGSPGEPPVDPYLVRLAAYRLSLTESRLSRFDTLADPVQRLLVNIDEPAYTAYALDSYGEGQARPPEAIDFAGRLPAATRSAFLARPDDVKDSLVALNQRGLAVAVLDPQSFESAPTDADLRRNLGALLALSPENRDLFRTFAGGPDYPKLRSAPAPYDWSDAAWTRTRNSFTALSPEDRSALLALGALDGLFDHSATFIEAALADYAATLPKAARDKIAAAGWGRYFADYFGRQELRDVFADITGFSTAQISALRQLDISPGAFLSAHYASPGLAIAPLERVEEDFDLHARLAHLASLPENDRALLAQLGVGDHVLFASGQGYYDSGENWVYPTYAESLQNALAFARKLKTDLPDALALLRQTGLGSHLLSLRFDETVYVGDSPAPALERIHYLLDLYSSLEPARRDLARDLGLFGSAYLGDMRLEPATIADTLDALASASAHTRDYLSLVRGEVPLLDLVSGGGEYNFYSLDAIDTLLASLTSGEFATLRELRPGTSLLRGGYEDGGILSSADLKSFLGYIASLGDLQRFTLNELGITQDGNERKGLFLSDHEGLGRLLQAYSELPKQVRAATRQLDTYDASGRDLHGPSFFFPSDDGGGYSTIYDVTFSSPDDLHVGAVRRLSILGYLAQTETLLENGGERPATFTVPAGKDIYLRASTLVDLNGVGFSPQVRAITIEAATINLANLDFPEGSVVALNSKLGGMGSGNRYPNFDGTSMPGRVNFLYDVSYGGRANIMDSEASFDLHSRGNIVLGTLQNPAVLPAYQPPGNNAQAPARLK